MKWKRIVFFVNVSCCCFLVMVLICCTRSNEMPIRKAVISKAKWKELSSMSYADQIVNVRNIMGESLDISSVFLLGCNEFLFILESPELYWKQAVDFIASNKYSSDQKWIAIHSMSQLPHYDYEAYLVFLEQVYIAYKNDVLCEDKEQSYYMFFAACFNGESYEFGTYTIRNYKKKKLNILLNKIKNDQQVDPLLRDDVGDILSGQALKGWKQYQCAYGQNKKDPE